MESADEPTVSFAYPQSFSDHSILQVIRLEIGALASWSPTKDAEIIFSDVWLWTNAPTNDGLDIGIDLVAKDTEDDSFWAIQCKCYDDDSTLSYSEVATDIFYARKR
ncbi:MAG: hypothetical protein IJ733_14205 [Lachnospiraceae bacterium]|nr:hypothetical protein [Lachnospiraceae bacterium]